MFSVFTQRAGCRLLGIATPEPQAADAEKAACREHIGFKPGAYHPRHRHSDGALLHPWVQRLSSHCAPDGSQRIPHRRAYICDPTKLRLHCCEFDRHPRIECGLRAADFPNEARPPAPIANAPAGGAQPINSRPCAARSSPHSGACSTQHKRQRQAQQHSAVPAWRPLRATTGHQAQSRAGLSRLLPLFTSFVVCFVARPLP